ncbi:MAG: DUF4278 domain-containing protein [Leptolyngbyaceae cyanobacterium CRU_2_3]|nr:DUF4278 domain-containing protein [Leptolyngbyaceae cyanobacterium CRU_2_3]
MTTFKYRGAEYNLEPTSPPEQHQADRTAQYRGQTYQVADENASVPQPVMGMIYRGVSYRTSPSNGSTVIRSKEDARSVKPTPIQTQLSSLAGPRPGGSAELHRRNLLQSLQRRLAIAKAKGDRYLMLQLQEELEVLTGAVLSKSCGENASILYRLID